MEAVDVPAGERHRRVADRLTVHGRGDHGVDAHAVLVDAEGSERRRIEISLVQHGLDRTADHLVEARNVDHLDVGVDVDPIGRNAGEAGEKVLHLPEAFGPKPISQVISVCIAASSKLEPFRATRRSMPKKKKYVNQFLPIQRPLTVSYKLVVSSSSWFFGSKWRINMLFFSAFLSSLVSHSLRGSGLQMVSTWAAAILVVGSTGTESSCPS